MMNLNIFKKLPYFSIFMFFIIASIGLLMLYSGTYASNEARLNKQLIRLGVGFLLMIWMSTINEKTFHHLSFAIYIMGVILLLAVHTMGYIGMGARRWINLGVISIQPSEVMRVGLILVLARCFSVLSIEELNNPKSLVFPSILAIVPFLLVLKQPDLGTATLMLLSTLAIFFIAGISIWYFAGLGTFFIASFPIFWSLLHEYQKKRIMIFLNPESDPTRSGYHVIQSKIAIGSGGLFGKGLTLGTQSQLDFLPEKQTDFIFTMFCEEFGFIGALFLICLYCVLLIYNLKLAFNAKSSFAKITIFGLTCSFFLYFFINMAMVMGLVPVVGVPLPLFSYGGSALMTLMISQGIIIALRRKNQFT
ncbi:MAG: rod shape-determining protein RodA [Candidatus Puniceispirillum sp.]|nr:rod shape-determining protein RodA [Candidatus Pelagibacter sp.]MBA4283301.1 rod shape-determining protein RodA [Candidatus Puniceispirillum sp.]